MKKFTALALVSAMMFLGACSKGGNNAESTGAIDNGAEISIETSSPEAEATDSVENSAAPTDGTITIDLSTPSATASADVEATASPAATATANEIAEWDNSGLTVREVQELVKKYLEDNNKYVPDMIVAEDQRNGEYIVQCYDNLGDHNSTSDWYIVNKFTGEIRNALDSVN